ncbi:WD40-repeat-containing domain protein [Suillus subluteus]|nr:WD40-repeat-containing domain protein [Suillus subluteus]
MIRVWSKDDELLVEIKRHAELGNVVLKWRTIDGKGLLVLRNRTNTINSLRLTPEEYHIPVGQPLLHDNELLVVTVSPDGQYIDSAGLDAKIYVWSLKAVLKHDSDQVRSAHDCNAKTYKKFQAGHFCFSFTIPSFTSLGVREDMSVTSHLLSALQAAQLTPIQGGDFWNNATNHDTNSTLSGSSALLGPLYFACTICLVALRHSTRKSSPTNTAPVPTLEFQLEKLRTFWEPLGRSRIGMTPETNVEATAAMQPMSDTNANTSTQQGRGIAGVQGTRFAMQGQPTQMAQEQNYVDGTEESSYVYGVYSKTSSVDIMPREEAGSGTLDNRTDFPALVTPPMSVEDLPPYGVQHFQDARWKGGNEALPPRWQMFKVLDNKPKYQDDTLLLVSEKRPLPGIRLDVPGDLVTGYEWHISPLGRSYFVNHNTRITSWKKPTPERPAGSLAPEYVIEGHSACIWSLACLGSSGDILSASSDSSIRQSSKDGGSVGKLWRGDSGMVISMALCPDETMLVSGSTDGRVQLWNAKEGNMIGDPWKAHRDVVMYLHWSPSGVEIVSGSHDGTIRRWNPHTGRQMAHPVATGHGWVTVVRYSPQGDKFASGGADKMIRVWSTDGELLVEINGHNDWVWSLCWSSDGTHIFSASSDCTIRKWQSADGKELVILRGHTSSINSLCLSLDESHLVSASKDRSVRIWDLKTNQAIGDPLLHDDQIWALAMFPDGTYFASAGVDAKVYVWSLDAVLKQQDGSGRAGGAARSRHVCDSSPASRQQSYNSAFGKYGDDFWSSDTNPIARRGSAPVAGTPSPLRLHNLFNFLRPRTKPVNAQEIPLKTQRRNFKFFSVRTSIRPVDVAPCRDEDRYGISPPSEAEVAAAMERPSDTQPDSSTQQGRAVAGTQGSQIRTIPAPMAQAENFGAGIGESLCVIGCCGLSLLCLRRIGD